MGNFDPKFNTTERVLVTEAEHGWESSEKREEGQHTSERIPSNIYLFQSLSHIRLRALVSRPSHLHMHTGF